MDPAMLGAVWDSPMVAQLAFPARTVARGHNRQSGEEDGAVEVDADVAVGYRLYHAHALPCGPCLAGIFFRIALGRGLVNIWGMETKGIGMSNRGSFS